MRSLAVSPIMSNPTRASAHATASELELYVIDALDPLSAAEVEAHVSACEACALALAGEARLEMAFAQVADSQGGAERSLRAHAVSSKRGVVHRRAVTMACAMGGALSLAAAWLLWLSPGGGGAGTSGDHALGAGAQDIAAHRDSYVDDASGTTASLDARFRDVLDGG
jgi:anti-sigma factor RsiW